jgi:hypothetical protein
LDVGAVIHYTGQYEDDNVSLTQTFFFHWRTRQATNAEKWAFALARAESAGVDYSRCDCVVHV